MVLTIPEGRDSGGHGVSSPDKGRSRVFQDFSTVPTPSQFAIFPPKLESQGYPRSLQVTTINHPAVSQSQTGFFVGKGSYSEPSLSASKGSASQPLGVQPASSVSPATTIAFPVVTKASRANGAVSPGSPSTDKGRSDGLQDFFKGGSSSSLGFPQGLTSHLVTRKPFPVVSCAYRANEGVPPGSPSTGEGQSRGFQGFSEGESSPPNGLFQMHSSSSLTAHSFPVVSGGHKVVGAFPPSLPSTGKDRLQGAHGLFKCKGPHPLGLPQVSSSSSLTNRLFTVVSSTHKAQEAYLSGFPSTDKDGTKEARDRVEVDFFISQRPQSGGSSSSLYPDPSGSVGESLFPAGKVPSSSGTGSQGRFKGSQGIFKVRLFNPEGPLPSHSNSTNSVDQVGTLCKSLFSAGKVLSHPSTQGKGRSAGLQGSFKVSVSEPEGPFLAGSRSPNHRCNGTPGGMFLGGNLGQGLSLSSPEGVTAVSNPIPIGYDFRKLLLPSPFQVEFLAKASQGAVHPGIRDFVIDGITHGFKSGYKGGDQVFRDYSKGLTPSELTIMVGKMEEDVGKGFCIGPFKVCPFPCAWSKAQAICCLQFLRPKHRFKDIGKFRLISHRSFPRGRSFNDLVPRNDCKMYYSDYQYFTFATFLSMVAEMGNNTLVGCFDVKDAYKQCKTHPSNLWQQVYKVGDVFYIDTGGMFGSKNAADTWNLVMELITESMKARFNLRFLRYFVDNGVNLTPPVNGEPDTHVASTEFKQILQFLTDAGVPFHEVVEPATSVVFLGWAVDTVSMTVTVIPERMEWLDEQLKGIHRISLKAISSMVGTFEFLAAVLTFLKAPLGWLRHREIELEQGISSIDNVMVDRVSSYLGYMKKLMHQWGGQVKITKSKSAGSEAGCVLFVDASGTQGRGAISLHDKAFAMETWAHSDIVSATRLKGVSSAALELLNAGSAICTFAQPGDTAVVFSDSSAAVAMANKKYGRAEGDQWALICLDRFCMDNGVKYEFKHLPREDIWIQMCDELSKGEVCPALHVFSLSVLSVLC